MRLMLGLLVAASAAWAEPRLVFTKEFPGSVPPWVRITVERSGEAVYKESPTDDYPIKSQLTSGDAAEMFRLAGKLDHFSREIESGLKVAKMGQKTFRYEDGAEARQVQFNYSADEDARALLDFFERINESAQLYIQLERSVKYERLGVNDAILRLEAAFDRKRVIGTAQFLPLLDRVAKNDAYLHMARERAAALADVFRGKPAAAAPEP